MACGFVHLTLVRVVAQIAPNFDIAADAATHLDEGLHDDRAAVADLTQRGSDFVPRQPPFAGNAAIVLAGMKMPGHRPGGAVRGAEAVLLDVNMERIEHHLNVWLLISRTKATPSS